MDCSKEIVTAMPKFTFSTKGETLEKLSRILKNAQILPLCRLKVCDFDKDSDKTITHVQSFFTEDILIVRSSAKNEDSISKSNAGRFKSILAVPKANGDR